VAIRFTATRSSRPGRWQLCNPASTRDGKDTQQGVRQRARTRQVRSARRRRRGCSLIHGWPLCSVATRPPSPHQTRRREVGGEATGRNPARWMARCRPPAAAVRCATCAAPWSPVRVRPRRLPLGGSEVAVWPSPGDPAILPSCDATRGQRARGREHRHVRLTCSPRALACGGGGLEAGVS